MTDRELEPHRGVRWGRIIAVAALLLIVVVLVGHWVWGRGNAAKLGKQVEAYKAAGEPIEPADFIVKGVADADNAALDLRRAFEAIQRLSETWKAYGQLDASAFPLTEEEVELLRKVIADHAAVFEHVEKATAKNGVDWQIPYVSPMMQILLPHLNHVRATANLLASDAMLAHHEGDDARAMKRIEQILFIARATDRQPTLVSHLVSIGVIALASDRAAKIAPELAVAGAGAGAGSAGAARTGAGGAAKGMTGASREQVERLIAQLLDDAPQKQGQRMALFGERAMQLDSVRLLLSGKMGLNQLATGPGGGAAQNVAAALAGYALKPTFSSDGLLMIRSTTDLLNAAQAAPNYPAFQKTKPPFPIPPAAMPWQNVLARLMMPALERAIQTDYRGITDRRLAATALAVRLYALDHAGQHPPTLSALVPKYLPSLPLDPMAAGRTAIGYVPDPSRPMLYSVGENGVDNGGSDRPLRPGTPRANDRWQQADQVIDLHRQPRPEPEALDDGVGGLSTQPAATAPTTAPAEGETAPSP